MLNCRAVIIVVAALAVSFWGGAFQLPAQEPVSLTGHIKSEVARKGKPRTSDLDGNNLAMEGNGRVVRERMQ